MAFGNNSFICYGCGRKYNSAGACSNCNALLAREMGGYGGSFAPSMPMAVVSAFGGRSSYGESFRFPSNSPFPLPSVGERERGSSVPYIAPDIAPMPQHHPLSPDMQNFLRSIDTVLEIIDPPRKP